MARGTLFIVAALLLLSDLAGAAPDQTLIVLHKWGADLGAYDPETGQRRGGGVPLGGIPHEMAISPDGKWLYVTDYGVKTYKESVQGGNAVLVVDLDLRHKVAEIPLGEHHRPHGITLAKSGRLYVTTDFPPSVVVVEPAARRVVARHLLDQKLPHMLAVSKDERTIYTANSGSESITVLDVDAQGSASKLTNIVVGGDPMGLVLSSDEKKLYVANRPGDAVVVVDTAKRRVQAKAKLPGAPGRVQLVPGGGQLVVTLIEAGDVALLDARTLRLIRRVHVGDRPEGILFDTGARHVWVSVQGEDKVVKLALPKLNQVQVFATGSRPDPMLLVTGTLTFRDNAKPAAVAPWFKGK